jgi:HAD superfamily hydrolase (TIGR01459 family)
MMMSDITEISGLRAIADRFDHVLLDQWGTLHAGETVFPAARDCVARLRAAGKRVLTVSNSGKRARSNEQRLAALGLPPQAYDGILTSGEVAWTGLRTRTRQPFLDLGWACFLITRGGDHSIVDGLDLAIATNVEDAEFILLSGLDDDVAEPELWRRRLTRAAARAIPMLCINPDLVMFGATGLVPAPGALARFYAELGGAVKYVGKPHEPIFAAALERLGNPAPRRVLMVGDSLDHDIAGARVAGMLTVLLSSGVHKDLLVGGRDRSHALRNLAGSVERTPDWIMTELAW